jgi:hypothetical protein
MDDTNGKAYIVVSHIFFVSARSIQNSEFAKNDVETVYFGTDYTFPFSLLICIVALLGVITVCGLYYSNLCVSFHCFDLFLI